MTDGFQTEMYKDTGRTYRQEMEYYQTFTIYNYMYGSGGSAFIDEMWDTYRDNYNSSDTIAPASPTNLSVE
jgi:hypothetical protein